MLPKIDLPTYTLHLPSNNQEVTVRPFLVKEEKLLLMAVKSNDAQEIIRATKQVITNCIISPEINVDTLPFFDIDYLFIALRAKSVGETVELNFICQNQTEAGKCGNKFPVKLDIANIEVSNNDKSALTIKFYDDLIFTMKYPSYSIMKSLDENADKLDNNIKIIASCVDRIFTKGQYYTSKDFTPEELHNFIENLTQQQYQKLEEFTQNFPSFVVKASAQCNKCGKQHTVRYKDFISFFQ
jgi:hypothetical protein